MDEKHGGQSGHMTHPKWPVWGAVCLALGSSPSDPTGCPPNHRATGSPAHVYGGCILWHSVCLKALPYIYVLQIDSDKAKMKPLTASHGVLRAGRQAQYLVCSSPFLV